ncbi:MAG: TIGR02147 family protein [Fibrobacteria bacterium]
MKSIFTYNDYRQYLKDHFEDQKARKPAFSHRFLLRKLGVTSSGFLANILSGRRHLPSSHVSRLVAALGLGKKGGRYFETLVAFNQAKKVGDKTALFQELVQQKPAEFKLMDGLQLKLFSTWYYVAIRELVFFFPMREEYETLARKLVPPIRPSEARAAVQDLLEIDLLERDGRGYLRQKQRALSTGDEVRSVHAAKYQRATMDLAKGALDRIPHEDRDISTLTLTLSNRSFQAAVDEVRALRKRLLKLAVDESAPDRVFQCNLQLFPLSRK